MQNGPSNISTSDAKVPNPVSSTPNQAPQSGKGVSSDNKSEMSGATKRKGGRGRRKKKSMPSGNSKNKLGNPTKLALDVKTIDFRRSRANYFCPPFGPLQEVYHYLKPRMRQYYNDYCRSLRSENVNYSYEFFYQSFAYRISELYLSKIWLFAAPDRFLSAHYDQIKALLNSTQPMIKQMVQDVSKFIGNFELHDKFWVNKFPLLVVSHHWLQAAYGFCSTPPIRHLNSRRRMRTIDMSNLPIVITPIPETWPFTNDTLGALVTGEPDFLTCRDYDHDMLFSRTIQDWLQYPVDINKITIYLFNGMIDPTPTIHDWILIPTNADPNRFQYLVDEDNPLELHPTLFQGNRDEVQRPCLTRFFPWRTALRSKSAFIIQFNCEFLRSTYNSKLAREGLENITMSLAATLLQLIGSEIDTWMHYRNARFVLPANLPHNGEIMFKNEFAVTQPEGWDKRLVNNIIYNVVLIQWTDDSGQVIREPFPIHLKYKLPLWWHAYSEFDELNEMNGFLHPIDGYDDVDNIIDPNQYDVCRHWWKWCMAGIYPRWQPYRHIVQNVEAHLTSAIAHVQLDFLKGEIPVSNYKTPDFSGSSVQLSRIWIKGQSENIEHLTDSPEGEIINGFVITDRANWIPPTHVGPWDRDFTWLTHFEGLDQVRRIKDIISTFFPQTAWSIANQKR